MEGHETREERKVFKLQSHIYENVIAKPVKRHVGTCAEGPLELQHRPLTPF